MKKLLTKGYALSWTEEPDKSVQARAEANGVTKSGKRVRYVCPHGDMKAWARHGAKLVCGEHMVPMVPHQPTPADFRDITLGVEESASEEAA